MFLIVFINLFKHIQIYICSAPLHYNYGKNEIYVVTFPSHSLEYFYIHEKSILREETRYIIKPR